MLYRRGRIWWARVQVNGEVRRTSLGCSDKATATVLHADILRAAALERAGHRDPLPRRRCLADDLDAYDRELVARGVSAVHRRDTMRSLRSFADWCPVSSVTSLRHSHGAEWLVRESQRRRQPRPGQTACPLELVSAATVNRGRGALRAWGRWLVRDRRVDRNPFADLASRSQERDRRLVRRSLTVHELRSLIAAAPEMRGLVYLLAATTGMRRAEVAAVRIEDVDLEARRIWVRASDTKNRHAAEFHLHADVAVQIGAYLDHRDKAVAESRAWPRRGPRRAEYLFPSVPRTSTLYRDLERAGVPRETARGVVDFHALRHTFATLLAESGASLVVAQRLMRHSDPSLTSGVYTHVSDAMGRGAVDGLLG